MKTRVLFCWLGATDLRAVDEKIDVGLGPVAQAVEAEFYKEVVLLNNWDMPVAKDYAAWLQERTSANITLQHVSLSSPTDFGEIYQAASKSISEKINEHGENVSLVFHLSPGTPAMATVWILLAKTRFTADLIESSKEYGVRPVTIPFDISADFIPEFFRKPDQNLERLAAGLPDSAPAFEDIIHRSEIMQRIIPNAVEALRKQQASG